MYHSSFCGRAAGTPLLNGSSKMLALPAEGLDPPRTKFNCLAAHECMHACMVRMLMHVLTSHRSNTLVC